MKRIAVTIVALAFTGAALAAPPVELPALTRIASKLSGLPAKKKVTVRVVSGAAIERQARRQLDRGYPPRRQAYDEVVYRALGLMPPGGKLRPALLRRHVDGVRSIYDPSGRVAYVRRGTSSRSAVLHEVLLALQDQSFDLRRLAGAGRSGRDAGLAAGAAVEGLASYVDVGSELSLGAGTGSPLDLFLELESEFKSATGARFAAILDELGGRSAVYSALRRFPETTEQVFHVDAFLERERPLPVLLPESAEGFALAGSETWGELDVRALLAVFQVPRVNVAGAGWGGGASALYRGPDGNAVALVLEWDSPEDAAQWAEAVEVYVNEAFEPEPAGRPATAPCATEACWSVGGRAIAFARVGTATAVVFGPRVDHAAVLARALAPAPRTSD